MSDLKPTKISADRNLKTVTINWSDGHISNYTFAGLRVACPCVECKGGHAYMGAPPDLDAIYGAEDNTLLLDRIEKVGAYALQFFWSDGHSTGIYTWQTLRDACTCQECYPQQDASD